MSALLAFVLAAAAATQAQAPVTTWNIDPSHTAASFAVKHMMVSTVRGSLGKVTGTVQYDGKDLNTLQVDVTIDVAAINTQNEGRDKHLRSPDFFEVEKFPTMTFKSKKAAPAGDGKFKLVGDLTMKGVTKEVTLDVEGPSAPVTQKGRDGSVRQRVGASASTKISRKEFGVMYNSMMDAGPVVGDEIVVTLDIEAVAPAPTPSK
jgi:polyisoprenoid-binding protein YceI